MVEREGVGIWELTPSERLQIAGLYAMIGILDCRLCMIMEAAASKR